ncbi:MAG: hypothetical protein ABEL76_12325 [Bradymonadaceae bacterium]
MNGWSGIELIFPRTRRSDGALELRWRGGRAGWLAALGLSGGLGGIGLVGAGFTTLVSAPAVLLGALLVAGGLVGSGLGDRRTTVVDGALREEGVSLDRAGRLGALSVDVPLDAVEEVRCHPTSHRPVVVTDEEAVVIGTTCSSREEGERIVALLDSAIGP